MKLIDADLLIDDCKRYLATLNPDRDGKECTRIRWLIGVLDNAPSAQQDVTDTNVGDMINRQAAISRAVTITMFGRDIRVVGVSELENYHP